MIVPARKATAEMGSSAQIFVRETGSSVMKMAPVDIMEALTTANAIKVTKELGLSVLILMNALTLR